MNQLDKLKEQLKKAKESVLECSNRLDNFNNKDGEWDDIYDHLCQGEIEKELQSKRQIVLELENKIKDIN